MNTLELHFNPKDQLFEVFSFEPESDGWGTLYIVAELHSPLPASKRFLSHLAQLIHQEFVSCAEKSKRKKPAPDACLKTALRKANTFLAQEVKKGNVQWVGNLHIAVLAVASNSAYFTKSGNMRLWISRGGSFTDIGKKLEESAADAPKIFGAMSTGKIAEGDRLLILNKDLLASLKKEGIWNDLASVPDDKAFKKAFKGKEEALSGLLFSLFFEPAQEARSLAHRPLPQLPRLALPSIPVLPVPRLKVPQLPDLSSPFPPRIALIALALLSVLGIGFFFFQRGNQDLQEARGEQVRLEVLMRQADIALEERRDTEGGRLLQEAWEIAATNAVKGNPLEARFAALRESLETRLADVFAIHSLADPSPLYDLSQIEGFDAARLFLAGDKIISYHPSHAGFVSVGLVSEEAEKVSADQNLTLGVSAQNDPLFFAQPNSILAFSEESWSKQELQLPSSGLELVDFAEFYGNLYALSRQGQVFLYRDALRGKAIPTSWIHPSSSLARVQEPSSLAVDGNIWIAEGNSIHRFYKGTFHETLSPSLFPELQEITDIATRESLPNLYLLDADKNRVIILTKFGELVAQYQSPAFHNLRDMAVSPDGKTVYLLNGSTIYALQVQ